MKNSTGSSITFNIRNVVEHENVSSIRVITLITRISSVIGMDRSGNIVLITLI